MRLGLVVGYSGAQVAIDMNMIKEAESLGFDSVWTAEAWGSDAVSTLAWIGAQTSKIKLGAAIMQLPGRSPANTAMTAMTIDALSGGRMILGLGTSGPQEAIAAVTDDMVDRLSLVGPPERIRDQFQAWKASPVTTLIVRVQQPEALRLIAELALS